MRVIRARRFVSGCSHRFFMRIPGCNSCHARSLTEIMRDRRLSCVVVMVSLLTKYSYQRIRPIWTLNQTTKDWHSRSVTLSEAKGLAVRFFAALRMTLRLRRNVYQCRAFRVITSGKAGGLEIVNRSKRLLLISLEPPKVARTVKPAATQGGYF